METAMLYDPSMTLRAARQRYFEDNGFGADGGYGARWVDFKLGPLPMPFPNTDARRRAVVYHDLHHLVTGYRTDFLGELEISAWEIGAGCKGFVVPWQLNLAGLYTGAFLIPRRTFRAFLRGRRSESLYGRSVDALLDRTVGEVTAEALSDEPAAARASDYALFALAFAAGCLSSLLSLALFVIAGPLFALLGLVRPAPRAAVS
ncbi:MAG: hypothetical protein U0359_26115 [Byssovorax sp.]